MIRWRFVTSRLIVLLAIVYILGLGLGPIAKYVVTTVLQKSIGSRVTIAAAEVGFFPPRIRLDRCEIADPRTGKNHHNAVAADRIQFSLDATEFLHRRLVAQTGRIEGLRIGGKRDSDGHLPNVDPPIVSPSDAPSALTRWLTAATGGVADGATEFADDLETVRRSREIRADWQRQYDTAVADAESLRNRIDEIRRQARGIDNPLRDWDQLRRALAEADATATELIHVRQQLEDLPQRLQKDLASMEQAKQIDLQKLDQYVPGDLAGADKLGVDLVRDAIASQIKQIRQYIDHGKTVADYTVVSPEDDDRHRGTSHHLDLVAKPDILIRRCEVSGQLRHDGRQYELSGIVENLTPTPSILVQPSRARLRLDGPDVIRLDYVQDRRGDNDRDVVTLHWPDMNAETMRLGSGSNRIDVRGGRRELWVRLDIAGDDVEGRLLSKQTGVEVDLSLEDSLAESTIGQSLDDSLANVDRIEITADLRGQWDDLDIRLHTSLGRSLQLAARAAVDGQVDLAKAKLSSRIEKAQTVELQRLRDWIGSHQDQAQNLLAEADSTIEQMRQKIVSEIGENDYIGRLNKVIPNFK